MTHYYLGHQTLILVAAMVFPILMSALHYVVIGPKGKDLAKLPQTVQRFDIWFRIVHVVRALAFVLAGLSGYWLAFQASTPAGTTVPHIVLGRVFLVASILSMIFLLIPGLPRSYDRVWLKHFGGYLSRRPVPLRAGKYNAGQKIFIWLSLLAVIGLAITGGILDHSQGTSAWHGSLRAVHGLLAAFAVVMVIGHLYLSLVAVPGTWKVLFHGRVAIEWLAHHHPDDTSLQEMVKTRRNVGRN